MLRICRVSIVIAVFAAFAGAQGTSGAYEFEHTVRPLLTTWCSACHGATKKKAGLDVTKLAIEPPTAESIGRVQKMRDVLSAHEMPPPDTPKPGDSDVRTIVEWAEAYLDRTKDATPIDPGRVTMRRLSRTEYQNTIRDLLGVTEDVTSAFPPDNLAYGFDNIGDAASFSLLHIEKYLAAAESVAARAIETDDPQNPEVRHFECEFMTETVEGVSLAGEANFYSSGRVMQNVKLPRDGTYVIRARAYGDQAGKDIARLGLFDDTQKVFDIEVPETRAAPGIKEARVELSGGARKITVGFLNDYYDPDNKDPKQRDRNLSVDWIEIIGPVDARPRPFAQQWIFAKDPKKGAIEARAKAVVSPMASACFRRPATSAEISALTELTKKVVASGQPFEEGVRAALIYCLVSPHFLYRLEPGDVANSAADAVDLKDYALASRLSYFLWSSMPDDKLIARAAKGELRTADALVEETKRMLHSEKSDALAENFAAQWLELKNLDDLSPDPTRFTAFTPELRRDARREAQLFFIDILRNRRSIYDFIDPSDTFVNGRLAAYYGIPGIEGEEFRRVAVADHRRGGLLGQASMHALTSNPTRTSPVKRGKWVLENILDAGTPPPPPGVDGLKDAQSITTAKSLRERLAEHRKNPDCAVCHNRLDALGFALENYDPIGRWRGEENGETVDTSGTLPSGEVIRGPEDLRRVLKADPGFVRCLTKKLFVYAVGRDVGPADRRAIDALIETLPKEKPTLEDLIVGIVKTDAFRRRRAGR